MEEKNNLSCSLEQELASQVSKLDSQRLARENNIVDITLQQIVQSVQPKTAEISVLVSSSKSNPSLGLCKLVTDELARAADGILWCPNYDARSKGEQNILLYTGTHWQGVNPQLWKDFVGLCAERVGVQESQRANPAFMNKLFEHVAFNLSEFRVQKIPVNEVWLNMLNGTLVISRDGMVTLREHNKSDLFRYTLPYSYDPQADCPLWHKFLDRVLPSADTQLLLQEFTGYCLMSTHSLEKMLLLYGEGLNGKSVTLEVIEGLLGSTNVSYLSLADLTNDEVKRSFFEDKMLNISHESGKEVNANVLKQLTSGEPVVIKHLYHDPRETSNYGKLMAAFNILPRAENSFGFFRRLLMIPYKVTIPKTEIDRQLATKLKGELPGILNWVLSTLPDLMRRGSFSNCKSSEEALERYRLQSDSILLFLSEMCTASESQIKAADLHSAYKSYCYDSGLKEVGRNKFISRLESMGYIPKRIDRVIFFNLKLR